MEIFPLYKLMSPSRRQYRRKYFRAYFLILILQKTKNSITFDVSNGVNVKFVHRVL